jgi:hypothetical protein
MPLTAPARLPAATSAIQLSPMWWRLLACAGNSRRHGSMKRSKSGKKQPCDSVRCQNACANPWYGFAKFLRERNGVDVVRLR